MLDCIIASVISIGLIAATVFGGHRIFTWAFATGDASVVFGIYVAWYLGMLFLAFASGLIGSMFFANAQGNNFSITLAFVWVGLFILSAIYPWFKLPYTIWFVLIRVGGTLVFLATSVWVFLMIALMGTSTK